MAHQHSGVTMSESPRGKLFPGAPTFLLTFLGAPRNVKIIIVCRPLSLPHSHTCLSYHSANFNFEKLLSALATVTRICSICCQIEQTSSDYIWKLEDYSEWVMIFQQEQLVRQLIWNVIRVLHDQTLRHLQQFVIIRFSNCLRLSMWRLGRMTCPNFELAPWPWTKQSSSCREVHSGGGAGWCWSHCCWH